MLLSIVIPSYNHQQFVLSTIRAAESINVEDKEILIIDDGSSDDSANRIRDYIAASGNSNLHLIARENRGLVKTLNQGLSIARGKYFYLVASDDIPIPKGIEHLISILETAPQLRFALGNALFMQSEEQREFRTAYGEAHRRFFSLPQDRFRRALFLHYPQPILLQSTVFRTSALQQLGGWREDITLDDMSLFTRMFSQSARVGTDFAFAPETLACYYRQHDSNISRNGPRQFLTTEELLAKLCPQDLKAAAFAVNLVGHGLAALKARQFRQAREYLSSTVNHAGMVAWTPYALFEFVRLLARKFGRPFKQQGPQLTFDPAATSLRKPTATS